MASQFDLKITAFGFDGRHVKISIQRLMPSPSIFGDTFRMSTWLRGTVDDIVNEVKHSGKWRCSECGKPARDTQFDVLSYLHKPEPSLIIYVHQLCEAKDGPCDRAAKAESNVWRKDVGFPPNPPSSTRNINPAIQPLSRSCAKCHRDPAEPPEMKLKRCGRCHWIRYCSVACQTEDYPRHKKVCKSVSSIEYAKWEADDRD